MEADRRDIEMTQRLYYTDSALLDFEAKIIAAGQHGDNHYTVLERSAFYPTSGGQQHDTGVLGGQPVIDVIEIESGEVWHITAQPVGSAGETVKGEVDRQRRQLHRQQHTAQHILSQVFVKLYGLETVSMHLGDEYGAIELETAELATDQLAQAEKDALDIIFDNLPVETLTVDARQAQALPLRKIPSRSESIRVVKIGEFDYSACGGTHCRSTAEVGMIKITGVEKMRGRVLVNFLSGRQAAANYSERFGVTDRLARELTCHVTDLPDKMQKMIEETKALRKELAQLQKEMIPQKAEQLAASAIDAGGMKYVHANLGDYDPRLAGQLAGKTVEITGGVVSLYTAGRLVIATDAASGQDASAIVKKINEEAGTKGGGSARQAQVGGVDEDKLDQLNSMIIRFISDG